MREIRAGTVWINDPLTDNDAGPFGGFKQSGLGRELGQEGLEAFQETKHVHIETQDRAEGVVVPLRARATPRRRREPGPTGAVATEPAVAASGARLELGVGLTP